MTLSRACPKLTVALGTTTPESGPPPPPSPSLSPCCYPFSCLLSQRLPLPPLSTPERQGHLVSPSPFAHTLCPSVSRRPDYRIFSVTVAVAPAMLPLPPHDLQHFLGVPTPAHPTVGRWLCVHAVRDGSDTTTTSALPLSTTTSTTTTVFLYNYHSSTTTAVLLQLLLLLPVLQLCPPQGNLSGHLSILFRLVFCPCIQYFF